MTTATHYFFAIPLPAETKKWLYDKQLKLKVQKGIAYHNWTTIEDFHITLAFLGHISVETKEKLINSIEQVRIPPFELSIGGLGWFGLDSRPRVLWIGVEKLPALLMLQKQIVGIAEQNGFKQDSRAYHPHITLAKKWRTGELEEKQLKEFETMISEQWKVKVDQFILYKINTDLTPRYQIVNKFKL